MKSYIKKNKVNKFVIDKDNLKQVLINLGFIASEKENILKKNFL